MHAHKDLGNHLHLIGEEQAGNWNVFHGDE